MAINSANQGATNQQIRMPKTGEVVAERLRRQIARGELTIGQRLPPEDELTAQFGIARTTLREGLRILESQGLLEIRRGRTGGPVVTMPEIDSLAEGLAVTLQLRGTTVGDLDVARQLIEPRLAGRLAQAHTAADIAALRIAADRAAPPPKRPTVRPSAPAAVGIHETLIERAGNTTLATFSHLLHSLVARHTCVRRRAPTTRRCTGGAVVPQADPPDRGRRRGSRRGALAQADDLHHRGLAAQQECRPVRRLAVSSAICIPCVLSSLWRANIAAAWRWRSTGVGASAAGRRA